MDLLEKLQMVNAALYREFMMVSVKTSKFGTEDYYVGVPNKALLALFDGFDPVEEAELPKPIDTLHVADVTEFESRFQFAHNNRSRKAQEIAK
jgi:hypothetical protein